MALPVLAPSKEPSRGLPDRSVATKPRLRFGVLPIATGTAALEPITPFDGVILRKMATATPRRAFGPRVYCEAVSRIKSLKQTGAAALGWRRPIPLTTNVAVAPKLIPAHGGPP